MAKYEKQVEQEAAYPIPISLYNCYRTVRHEKRYQEYIDSYASLLLPHCPVTVVQRYRDGVCSLLFHLFFIICHPYIPLHLEEMIFYTCAICVWCVCICTQEYSKSCPLTMPGSVGQSRQVCLSGTLRNQEEPELISTSIFDCKTTDF